jgi:hypothetical protein
MVRREGKILKKINTYIILLSAFLLIACGEINESQSGNYKSFNYDLRGAWVSNEPGLYSGSLTIDSETITIDGYGEDWTSLVGDDNKRPFKDLPKRVPLKGYSEEGKIFIDYGGTVQNGIPYYFTETEIYSKKYKLLEFSFSGRKEILQQEF